MSRALVFKEWREHRFIVAALWLLTFAFAAFEGLRQADAGSPFRPFQMAAPAATVVLGLVLANRLVVREYASRTQLFLEALPITRVRVLATKWVLGAVGVVLPLLLVLAACTYFARERTVVTPELLARISLRALAFALFFHALAFSIGLLGRYRWATWVALGLGLMVVDQLTQLEFSQLVPFRLLSATMVVEREQMPWMDLAITAGLTSFLVALAGVIALGREGAWVAAFAHRMSRREKVSLLVAAVVPVTFITAVEHRKPKPRFDLIDAVRAQTSGRGLVVGISRPPTLPEAEARSLGAELASDLDGMAEWLGVTTLPAVFVVPDASLDPDYFTTAALPKADGVVLKGALGAVDFDRDGFRVFAVHEALDWFTRGRAKREPRHWLLDGFAAWWVSRSDARVVARLEARADAATHLVPLTAGAFERWDETQELLGDCLANAFAFRAVSLLLRDEGARALFSEALGVRPMDWAVAPLLEGPIDGKLAERLAVALRDAPRTAGPPPGFTRWSAAVEAVELHGSMRELRFEVRRPQGEAGERFAVRYRALRPWSGPVYRGGLTRFDAAEDGVLPMTTVKGQRMFTAVERYDPALQCTVRLGARRWVVP